MIISRHKTEYWIKNNSVDVSIKGINGHVAIHWHEFYEIELILEGAGVYHIDDIDYKIEKGTLFVMSPSSFHYIDFTEDTRLINFMFAPDVCDFNFLYNIFSLSPHITLHLEDQDVSFFHTLAREMASGPSAGYQSVMANCILGKIQSLTPTAQLPLRDEQMQRAVLYIQNHFRENICLDQAAEIANYSPNYFGNKFKQYTGVTFKNYIMNLRFSLAEKLLRHTALSVTEISCKCGFQDFSNFMVYFKKRYGKTPGQFRSTQ